MLSFVYQIQRKGHSKWYPYIPYNKTTPMEFTDLDKARIEFLLLRSKFNNVRLVKIETYQIY